MLLFFCCFRLGDKRLKKQYLYEKAKKHIDNYMDILKVTRKFIEIDYLKYLILNEDQLLVSKIIGKPFITLNNKDLHQTKFNNSCLRFSENLFYGDYQMKNFKEEVKKEISDAFQRIENKSSQSIVDKKLILSAKDNIDLVESND